MSECLDADALVDVGHALEWRVEEGLNHLHTCTECRRDLEALQHAREALLASIPVPADSLHPLRAALHEAGRGEVDRTNRRARLTQAVEACTAGVAALLILVSNGVPIDGPAPAVAGFSLGAILMVIGTTLHGRLSTFPAPPSHQ